MSLWNVLGFRSNPYFTTPIELSEDGRDLFVGRDSEIRRFLNKWDETDGCVTIVGGNIGTGKTSFLNICQFLSMTGIKDFGMTFSAPRLVPASKRVQMEVGQKEPAFLLQILHACIESIRFTYQFNSASIPPSVEETANWLESLLQSQSNSLGGGLSLGSLAGPGTLSIGGNLTKSVGTALRKPDDLTAESLMVVLKRLALSVRDEKFRGVIIAIDNIEMVPSNHVVETLNKYRDTLFQTPGVWWVLIGQRGLYDLVDAEAPRVSQRIKGTETTLEGMSWEEFHLAMMARVEHFRLRSDAVPPLDESLLKKLFDASRGEIRYVFKMADEIVSDAIGEDPKLKSVPPIVAESMLRKSVTSQIRRLALSPRESRVLKLICERKEARPKEYKEFGFQNAPNFIQGVLQPLQEKGLVVKSTQGNAAIYSPRPLAILGQSFDALKADSEDSEEDSDGTEGSIE